MTTQPDAALIYRGRYLQLDGLRGVLALLVMLFHFGLNTLLARVTGGFVRDGIWNLCVDVFFQLSGFVLCRAFTQHPPLSPVAYGLQRLGRLAPLFLITTLAAVLLAAPPAPAKVIWANLLMLAPFLHLPSVNFPVWSVPFELVLPGLGLVAVRHLGPLPSRWAAWLLAASLAGEMAAAGVLAHGVDHQALRAGSGLAAGALLYDVTAARRRSVRGRPRGWAALTALGVVVLAIALSGRSAVVAASVPALSLGAIGLGAASHGPLSTPPLQALGRWSYAIYLIHAPMLTAFERLLGVARVAGDAPLKLVVVATTLVLAAAAHRWIETPGMRLGRRWSDSRPLRVAGAT